MVVGRLGRGGRDLQGRWRTTPGFHSLYSVTTDGQRFLVVTEPEGRSSPPITVVLDWADGLKR